MKLQPGTIITIFLIIMFAFMIFLNSQAKNILERENNFDSAYSEDDIFLAYTTLQQDLETKLTILRKDNDLIKVFEESNGNLISIDTNNDKLLVHTESAIRLYDIERAKREEDYVPDEIALTNIQSLIPYDLRADFPMPEIKQVQFNLENPDELLLTVSQINEKEMKFCFIKRTEKREYEISQIPPLTIDAKASELRKTALASLVKGEFILFASYIDQEVPKLSAFYSNGEDWKKIDGLNRFNAFYFDIDKSNSKRIDLMAASENSYTFFSIEKQKNSNVKTQTKFKDRYVIKKRKATVQGEINSAFSLASDKKNQYLFYNKEGDIQQTRLTNWDAGTFSQSKTLKLDTPAAVLPELNKFWYAILTLLASVVFVIIFALLKRKRTLKQMLNPIEFLDDTKTKKATEKEEEKPVTSENDKKLRLLGRNDVERPKKEEIPDLGDPFSIYEHFGYIPAGLIIRTLSASLDLIFLAPVFYLLGNALGIRIDDLFAGPDWYLAHLLIIFVHFVYFVGFEYYFGKSLGKMITGIRAVTVENKPMKMWQIVVRNLTRIPDYYLFFVMMFNMRAQRIGDLITKTVVIFDAKDGEPS